MIKKIIITTCIMISLLAAIWIGAALGLRTHYQTFRFPSVSMQPTLQADERIIVDRKAYAHAAPQRGDIIVFKLSVKDKTKIHCKRVVGLPGEKLEIKGGKIFINGQLVRVPGFPDVDIMMPDSGGGHQTGEIFIPEGSLYVLGDNPVKSYDSRFWGPISFDDIYGKVVIHYQGKPPYEKISKLISTGKAE